MPNFWGKMRSTSPTPTERTAVCSPSQISLASTALVKYGTDLVLHDRFQHGDVEIVCGSTHFRVNSVVLSMSSTEFAKLKDSPEQVVLDVPAADMEVFLRLVHAGKPGFGTTYPTDTLGPAAAMAQNALLTKYGANPVIKAHFRNGMIKRLPALVMALGDRPSRETVLILIEMARIFDLGNVWVDAIRLTPNKAGWMVVHNPFTLTKEESAAYPAVVKTLLTTAQVCGPKGLKAAGNHISFSENGRNGRIYHGKSISSAFEPIHNK